MQPLYVLRSSPDIFALPPPLSILFYSWTKIDGEFPDGLQFFPECDLLPLSFFPFFKKIFYLFIYVCVHVHMSTCHVYADVLGETEIGDIFLVSGATGICEQPNMGTRNKFRSSRKAGRALNH